MCEGSCSRKCLIVLNIIFFFAGALLLGGGIWMKVDPLIVNYLHVVNINASDPLVDYAGLVFMCVGAFTFVISFMGCCGAIRSSQGMLFVYILLLCLLIIGEIVGAALALVYRGEVEKTLLVSMESQVKDQYVPATAEYDSFNFVQVKLECCGANNYTDYVNSFWWNNTRSVINGTQEFVPMQCCKLSGGDYLSPRVQDWKQCQEDARDNYVESVVFHAGGCHASLHDWFQHHALIMMIVGFAIGGVQILGIACACSLRRALKTGGKYTSN